MTRLLQTGILASFLAHSLVAAVPINLNSFFQSSWSGAAAVDGGSTPATDVVDHSSESYSSGSGYSTTGPTSKLSKTDQAILNLLLTAENLEANLYREGLTKFSNAADYEAKFPAFKGRNLFDILKLLGAQENDHRIQIEEALKKSDSQALLGDDLLVNANDFHFGNALDSIESWVSTIAQIEGGGTSGYLTALSGFENEDLRKAASSIASVEARHNAILRFLFSLAPSPGSQDASISPADVLTLVGGLIDPALLKDLAFAPHPALAASATNASIGDTVKLTPNATVSGQAWCAWLSQLVPEFSDYNSGSCVVPTSPYLGGQTYLAIVNSKSFADSAIVAGPTIIQLPPATGFAKFPPQFTSDGSVLNTQSPNELTITGTLSQSDQDIGNILLTAENLEANLYAKGLAKFSDDSSYTSAFGFPGLFKILTAFGSHENDHRVQISKALDAAGAKKVLEDKDNSAKFDFGAALDTIQSFISTIGQIEGGGTSGYQGAVGALKNPTLRQAAAQIMTVEARHNTFLRFLSKLSPSANDNDATITPADVLTLVGGLIADPELAGKLAFKAHTTLAVASKDTPKQGGWLTFAKVDLKGAPKAYCGFLSMLEPQYSPFYASNSSCAIPTSHQLGGQTYVSVLKDQTYDDAHIIAGPTIVELGPEVPLAPFP